eukprot:m.83893 g.83893  ORF g.83893 m.83893 type:complete len:345 (+) comp50823_c0_seq25:1110-2144(+)
MMSKHDPDLAHSTKASGNRSKIGGLECICVSPGRNVQQSRFLKIRSTSSILFQDLQPSLNPSHHRVRPQSLRLADGSFEEVRCIDHSPKQAFDGELGVVSGGFNSSPNSQEHSNPSLQNVPAAVEYSGLTLVLHVRGVQNAKRIVKQLELVRKETFHELHSERLAIRQVDSSLQAVLQLTLSVLHFQPSQVCYQKRMQGFTLGFDACVPRQTDEAFEDCKESWLALQLRKGILKKNVLAVLEGRGHGLLRLPQIEAAECLFQKPNNARQQGRFREQRAQLFAQVSGYETVSFGVNERTKQDLSQQVRQAWQADVVVSCIVSQEAFESASCAVSIVRACNHLNDL